MKGYRLIGIYLISVIAIVCWLIGSCRGCSSDKEERDTVIVVKHDTIVTEIHDTLPVERERKVVRYISIPCHHDSKDNDSMPEIMMEVIQKKYSDDSTYTAYVSGVEVDDLPKLDSINVKQRIITYTITETITIQPKKKHWHFGLQGGYGLTPKGFQPYAGIGFTYTFP